MDKNVLKENTGKIGAIKYQPRKGSNARTALNVHRMLQWQCRNCPVQSVDSAATAGARLVTTFRGVPTCEVRRQLRVGGRGLGRGVVARPPAPPPVVEILAA